MAWRTGLSGAARRLRGGLSGAARRLRGGLSGAARRLRAGGGAALRYALPPRCPACGVMVAADGQFCADCWTTLSFLDGPACAACSIPLPHALDDAALCGACQANPPPYLGAPAALAYATASRTVVMGLKYGRRLGNAAVMAKLMRRPLDRLRGDVPLLLVPVPLHRWRIWSRGFNQAAVIARALAALTGDAVADDVLMRRRQTPSLRGLSRTQRAAAVAGAFALADDARAQVAGRHIVLVDDVHASGATLAACARALRRAGAARISGLAFARVVPEAMGGFALGDVAVDFAWADADISGNPGTSRESHGRN